MWELGATWIEETVEYIASNPQFIVNGFIQSGILPALDSLPIDDDNDGLAAYTSDDEQDSDKEESQDDESDEEKSEEDSSKYSEDDSTTEDDSDSQVYPSPRCGIEITL